MTGAKLRLTIPLGHREHQMSCVSRIALRNGRSSGQRLCLDLGIDFWRLADGQDSELMKLASLLSVAVSDLRSDAIVRDDAGYTLRGQRLMRGTLRRGRVHVCPSCLLEDLERWTDIRVETRPYGRSLWLLSPIRTCADHERALVEIASGHDATTIHDFTNSVRNILSKLSELKAGAASRRPSLTEEYLSGRLEGAAAPPHPLDELPFFAAAQVSETIGAIAAFGAEVRLRGLTDDQWHHAGDAGFEITSGGMQAIGDLLARVRSELGGNLGAWNRRGLFQTLDMWLSKHAGRTASGDRLFPELPSQVGSAPVNPVSSERPPAETQTVATAIRRTGRHPKRLRKMLMAAGYVRADDAWLTHGFTKFEVTPDSLKLLEAAKDSMSLNEAGRYINAPRVQVELLFNKGFIKPFLRRSKFFKDYAFTRAELDCFLAKLTIDAQPTDGEDLFAIPPAAKRAKCSSADIVALLLERKLSRVGIKPDAHGYMSILVDVREVCGQLPREHHGGVTLKQAERLLRTSTQSLTALLDAGHLPSHKILNPVNRTRQRIVMPADLDRFMAEYASLLTLAREGGIHFLLLKAKLDAAGVQPAFDPVTTNATFYRRSEIPPI